jgi:hypothetical protein
MLILFSPRLVAGNKMVHQAAQFSLGRPEHFTSKPILDEEEDRQTEPTA